MEFYRTAKGSSFPLFEMRELGDSSSFTFLLGDASWWMAFVCRISLPCVTNPLPQSSQWWLLVPKSFFGFIIQCMCFSLSKIINFRSRWKLKLHQVMCLNWIAPEEKQQQSTLNATPFPDVCSACADPGWTFLPSRSRTGRTCTAFPPCACTCGVAACPLPQTCGLAESNELKLEHFGMRIQLTKRTVRSLSGLESHDYKPRRGFSCA